MINVPYMHEFNLDTELNFTDVSSQILNPKKLKTYANCTSWHVLTYSKSMQATKKDSKLILVAA